MIDKEAQLKNLEWMSATLLRIASNKNLSLDEELKRVTELKEEYFNSKTAIQKEANSSPVVEPTKLLVFKREFLATPLKDQQKFGGYEISQNGKKLFKINSSNSQPMSKEQIEFCAQIELTRGLKQAKLTEKIAFLEAGSTVYILAADKPQKRIKFASMEHGIRGWAPVSKFAFLAKEAEMRKHNDHIDNTYGHNGKEILVDCPNGSGNMVWLPINELLPIQAPPATPESLNEDLGKDSAAKCPKCKGEGRPGMGSCPECGGYATDIKERKQSAKECPDCHGTFEGAEGQTCPTCGRFAVQKEALRPALPPQILNRRQEVNASGCDQCNATMINGVFCHEQGCPNARKEREQDTEDESFWPHNASLNKVAHIRHENGKWVVYNHDYTKQLGHYKTKAEAVHRLKSIEYWKNHKGTLRPFSKKVIAEVLTDPYQTLSTHITEMRTRMDQVNERLQNAPAVKTAKEDAAPEMDLAALFADLTQGIDLLETKLGGDDIEPELHKGVEELENKLWTLEEKLGLTPKLSEHEKAEPEHKEVVEKAKEMDKEAAVVTDETIEETTNDPSLANPSLTPIPPPTPGFQNIQPTDNDNLEISVPMPTSPPPPGQKWQFNSVDKVYVLMPDTTNPAKLV